MTKFDERCLISVSISHIQTCLLYNYGQDYGVFAWPRNRWLPGQRNGVPVETNGGVAVAQQRRNSRINHQPS